MVRRPNLELSVEEITPAVAEEMLKANTFNRKVADRLVDIYAEAMAAGEWLLNGEPIIFDNKGRLQSGQHRLLAVIASGCSIHCVVVRGAAPDGLYTLDTGRKRRLTDVLTLRGETDVANLATAVTWYWRYEHSMMDRPGTVPTTSHLLAFLEEHPLLRESVRAVRPLHSALGLSAGLYGALYHVFSSINYGEAETFFSLLATGEGLEAETPLFVLRRWIIRSRMGERRPTSVVYAAITIKAWNAYREHLALKGIRWAANESFPLAR